MRRYQTPAEREAEQREIDAIFARAGDENKAREAASDEPTPEDVAKQAKFLKGWAKGKPIVRQTDDSTFWAAGKWMTKLDYKVVNAIVAAGLGKLEGDAKHAGARLVMS